MTLVIVIAAVVETEVVATMIAVVTMIGLMIEIGDVTVDMTEGTIGHVTVIEDTMTEVEVEMTKEIEIAGAMSRGVAALETGIVIETVISASAEVLVEERLMTSDRQKISMMKIDQFRI